VKTHITRLKASLLASLKFTSPPFDWLKWVLHINYCSNKIAVAAAAALATLNVLSAAVAATLKLIPSSPRRLLHWQTLKGEIVGRR